MDMIYKPHRQNNTQLGMNLDMIHWKRTQHCTVYNSILHSSTNDKADRMLNTFLNFDLRKIQKGNHLGIYCRQEMLSCCTKYNYSPPSGTICNPHTDYIEQQT